MSLYDRVQVFMSLDKIGRILEYERMVHTHAHRSPTTAYPYAIFWNHIQTLCNFGGDHPLHRKDTDELS